MLAAQSDQSLLTLLSKYSPDCAVVICAAQIDETLLRAAECVRTIDHSCPLLLVTPAHPAEAVIRAMRAGVSDILEDDSTSKTIIESLLRLSRRHETSSSHSELGTIAGAARLVGNGSMMSGIRRQIGQVAASDASVLITGESGTGKELVAELIHRNSRRCAAPFVAVNCAAIPDALLESELFGHQRGAFTGAVGSRQGKLQAAGEGTLFLDEIGDMSLAAQAKILRAIENRVVQRLGSNVDDVVRFRVVAATNQRLEELTAERKFRQDLYFRLNVIRLELPPLRSRTEDIPELAESILREFSERRGEPTRRLEGDTIRRLQQHTWPGNIRELRNVLESIVVYSSGRSIGLSDLPGHICKTLTSPASQTDERSRILSALSSSEWNRDKASQILHCSRMTLYRKMLRYSIPTNKA